MTAETFAEKYDPRIVQNGNLPDDLQAVVQPFDEWGVYFGNVLHDYLSGEFLLQDTFGAQLRTYEQTGPARLRTTTQAIRKGDWDPLDALEADGRLQFHRLNLGMLPMWTMEAFRDTKQEDYGWRSYTEASANALAVMAINDFAHREDLASPKQRFSYFDEEHEAERSHLEGALNEVDTAIVLMEVAKQQRLTIVPAPPQFDRGQRPGSNVDFVAIDAQKRVIGIQTKTSVRQKHVKKYDDDIVMVDAQMDLRNQLARRTKMSDSEIRTVGWAGIIAAQRVHTIVTSRNSVATKGMQSQHTRDLTIAKMRVRDRVRDIPPALPLAAKIIGERIADKFAEQHAA